MERRRKQLMAQQPQWGDSLSPSPPLASQNGRQGIPTNIPITDIVDNTNRGSLDDLDAYDALIMADPSTRRKRASPVKPRILSCKDWTLESLVARSRNFARVPRIQWSPDGSTLDQIKAHEADGKGVPLVVEGLHNHPRWMKEKFTPAWLERNGPKEISVRNVYDRSDKNITLPDFIARTRAISPFATPGESERLYGKDVPCPDEWNTFLHSEGVVPSLLSPDGPDNRLNNLPEGDQPVTLMCYLGIGDTFTPCHKDLCASSGHNLMCYTENGGSSFWFMTETSSANAAAEYFHDKLNQELDHETHVITLRQLVQAPFKVYITEQRVGDMVLVPARSMHQVVNSGGLTIKTSWSRMTLDGLSLALRYELPLYRRVCRSEIYRVKSTIYYTLLQTIRKGSNLMGKQASGSLNIASTSQKNLPDTLLRLLHLFDSILIDEYAEEASSMHTLAPAASPRSGAEDDTIRRLTCDFCGCDVFQSFFECSTCVDGGKADPGGGFIVCSGCYVEGRSCHCETMVPMQCRSFADLLETRARGLDLFSELDSRPENHDILHIPIQEHLENEMGLFRAALILQKRRLKPQGNEPRRCTVRMREVDKSHPDFLPHAWVLPCKKCHSSTCLAHLTANRHLHSAEAFIAHDKDESHATFHESHKASKKRFDSEVDALKLEELNRVPDARVQLAYLAKKFTTCRPINSNSRLWKAGYYDLTVWETDSPADPVPNGMSATESRTVVSHGVSKPPKRMLMDCVFMQRPLSRPPKGKERQVAVAESSRPRARNEVDDGDDELPPPKKPKRIHPPNRPPVSRIDSLHARKSTTKHSRPRTVMVVDSSGPSDGSEDERPSKRPRVVPRVGKLVKPVKELHFKKNELQTAVSVADAFNNASVQNSRADPSPSPLPPTRPSTSVPSSSIPSSIILSSIPSTLPSSAAAPLPPTRPSTSVPSSIPSSVPSSVPSTLPSSAAAPALPRRYKRKVQLPVPTGLASPPETPSAATASSSTTENPLTPIPCSPFVTPAAQPRRPKRKAGPAPAPPGAASSSSSPNPTPASSSSTIESQLTTIMETLHSVQAAQVQQQAEVASMRLQLGGNVTESMSDAFAALDRQSTGTTVKVVADLVNSLVSTLHQPTNNMNVGHYRSYPTTRSGRGRGRGLMFGDHFHRGTPPHNNFRDYHQEFHRPSRGYYSTYNSAPAGPSRHTDANYERAWVPGPYADQHRRVSDEQGPRYQTFPEERREPREATRRRPFTRFSPPTSPENTNLDLVPARRRASGSALLDRIETASEGSVTVTNASMAMVRRNASVNPRTDKFFATLPRSESPDEQDWEAAYEKDTQS